MSKWRIDKPVKQDVPFLCQFYLECCEDKITDIVTSMDKDGELYSWCGDSIGQKAEDICRWIPLSEVESMIEEKK